MILGGGGLMATGILVLVVVLTQRLMFPSPSSLAVFQADDFAYLPSDCESVSYCRLGDLAGSPFFQDHLTRSPQLRGAIDQFRDRMGMELRDVDSMAIAIKRDQLGALNVGFSRGVLWGLRCVAVVRSSKPWDRTKLIGPHTQSSLHNNLTYHTFPLESQPTTRWAIYLPDANTLVVGTLPEVQAAMDTKGSIPEWPEMEFLQPEYVLFSARLPSAKPNNDPTAPRPKGSNLVGNTMAHMSGSGFSLENDAVNFATFTTWSSEAEAAEHISEAEKFEQEKQTRSPQYRRNGVPIESRFQQHGRTVTLLQDHDE
ncbi:MAG: hypothetical protein KDA84_14005, partial [Planctomycetaceae bacterium]|nr:hypothetical protein [Planctomycetaceae bacterium]